MGNCSVTISSNNLSGQTCNVVFLPYTGGSISLGSQVFPFTYTSNYFYGTYECYSPTYNYTYTITVPAPITPTPTVTLTMTPSPTP